MSQKKVDAYKEEKANRQKIIKREKTILKLEKLAAVVVCVVAVIWIAYSVQDKVTAKDSEEQIVTEMDTSALDNYLAGLSAEDAEIEEEAEIEDDAEPGDDAEIEDSAELKDDAETEDDAELEDSAEAEE